MNKPWEKMDEKQFGTIIAGILAVALAITAINAVQLADATASAGGLGLMALNAAATAASIPDAAATASILPSGVPAVYGKELAISFDDVSAANPAKADETIGVLAAIDVNTQLAGADLDRYINVLYRLENGISCEYCCGARAVIFENGEPACGCAHSYAMRGVAKYLITKHGSEYTDGQLLEEVGKWKTLFFPGQAAAKAEALASNGIELNYINLASNKYRGIERGTGSGMVGGC